VTTFSQSQVDQPISSAQRIQPTHYLGAMRA